MAMPNNLVLVRHGQSEANIIQKLFKENPGAAAPEGFFDRHDSFMKLSPQGREQAFEAGRWILQNFPEGFDRYYVSPHLRTRETAGRLAVNGNWNVDDRWRERDWGEYGILNDEEREAQFTLSAKLKKQNGWYWGPPGGESLATGVRLRFEDILETLHRETADSNVIAVTHGEMIEVARFVLERMTPEQWLAQEKDPAYKISNCQILHYTRTNPETGIQEKSLRWRRSISPWDSERSWNNGAWAEVGRTVYSDAELLAQAASYPDLLH
jgi:broad specificity phosphatase PhoE